MPKSVCRQCTVELRPEKNGVIVVEMYNNNRYIYKMWEADLWKCPMCGLEVVLGFASNPFMGNWDGEEACRAKLSELIDNGSTIIFDNELTLNP